MIEQRVIGVAQVDLRLPEQQHPHRPVKAVLTVADDLKAGITDHGLELFFADDAYVIGLLVIRRCSNVFLQVFGARVRHAQQIQRPRLADAHQFGEELRRIVDMLEDFGGDHAGGGGIGNRQWIAVGDVALDTARRGLAQTLAGLFDLVAVNVGDNEPRPTPATKLHVAAVTAADIDHDVIRRHREAFIELARLLVEPATELGIVQTEHERIDLLGDRRDRSDGRSNRGGGRRCEFSQKAQHEVAPKLMFMIGSPLMASLRRPAVCGR